METNSATSSTLNETTTGEPTSDIQSFSSMLSNNYPSLLLKKSPLYVPDIEVKNLEQELTLNLMLSAKLNTGITLKNVNCSGECLKMFVGKLHDLFSNDTTSVIQMGSSSNDTVLKFSTKEKNITQILLGKRKKRSLERLSARKKYRSVDKIGNVLLKRRHRFDISQNNDQCSNHTINSVDTGPEFTGNPSNFLGRKVKMKPQIRLKRDTSDSTNEANSTTNGTNSTSCDDTTYCKHPEYIVFTWVLCMIALATALKLYYLVKLMLTLLMVAIYTVLILVPYKPIFDEISSTVDNA